MSTLPDSLKAATSSLSVDCSDDMFFKNSRAASWENEGVILCQFVYKIKITESYSKKHFNGLIK
jgi:uracil DNA glycosylase